MLETRDFYYDLPDELIASSPSKIRDASRLMVLDTKKKSIEHKKFFEITQYLNKGDLLVLNDTKVINARLFGKKKTGGNAEALLLKKISDNIWECLVYPAKRIKKGCRIEFNGFSGEIIEEIDHSRRAIKFFSDEEIDKIIVKAGTVPLPPYIEKRLSEDEKNDSKLLSRYQTVYANRPGASAAPTAGLHFTKDLLQKINKKGVEIAYITLHTGAGTFIPVSEKFVKDHKMFTEEYEIGEDAAEKMAEAKKAGGKIVAVGTTSVRCLEDHYSKHNNVSSAKDEANIFIYPPYKFRAIDAVITNFHFPESTLLMMISAFAGKDFIMKAYKEAIKEKYRFYSFGDAMLIK